MGCVSSSEERVDAGGNGASPTAKPPQPTSATTPQPLYSGPSDPAEEPPGAQDSAASPSSRQERSATAVRRQGGAESDEDSDWDQCSTANYNMDQDEDKKDPELSAREASVVEKALNVSLAAEQTQARGAPGVPYRETSVLRIDKVKGCMFVNQYLVVKFLGRGACGKVFLCLNTHDLRLYAMKAVRKVDLEVSQPQQNAAKKRNPMEDLKREIMIMKKMRHTNIVTLSEVIDDPAGSKLLLVMEFMEGGPVLTREALEKRERLPEILALQYFRDMVKSLDYLHCNKVVHGDLKPENVLMAANGDVKLSDFGCSKVFATGNEYLERCNGTPAFLAPEMMKPNTRYRGRPTDVYALGACLYTLIFGKIPFSAPNLYKLFQVVQNEPVKYPEGVPISLSLKDLLQQLLTKNPRERISLYEVMKHPWVTKEGQFPLKSHRELKESESQEKHGNMTDSDTFAVCNPKPDFLAGLASFSAATHERTFNEGDVIMRQGESGTYLIYLVSGTVDILVKWATGAVRRANSQPGIPHHAGGRPRAGPPDDLSMDDSETLSPIVDEEARYHRVQLMKASGKGADFIKSLYVAAGSTSSSHNGTRDILVAQRTGGEIVGEMALFSKHFTRTATVRCSTKVTARIITHEQLAEFLLQQPMAKYQIREGIWKRESEVAIVEALVKLANVHEVIAASLEH